MSFNEKRHRRGHRGNAVRPSSSFFRLFLRLFAAKIRGSLAWLRALSRGSQIAGIYRLNVFDRHDFCGFGAGAAPGVNDSPIKIFRA